MKRPLRAALGLLCCSAVAAAGDFNFADPVMLKAGGKPIRVDRPGYAFPCFADVNGDGKKELLVGQFAGGKIKVYPHLGGLNFGPGEWLMAEGKPAEVPGVW